MSLTDKLSILTRPDRITLTDSEKALFLKKIAIITQAEQAARAAQADISDHANCIIERAGFPKGDYDFDPAGFLAPVVKPALAKED